MHFLHYHTKGLSPDQLNPQRALEREREYERATVPTGPWGLRFPVLVLCYNIRARVGENKTLAIKMQRKCEDGERITEAHRWDPG